MIYRFMKQVPITQAVKITRKRVKSFDDEKGYLSTGDLNVNVIKNLEPVTYENRPSRADLIVDVGDLIVARMQATKKVMLISEEEKDIIVSTGFLTLKSKEGWDNEFLYFYFNSPNFQDQKDRLCTGATQKAINNTKFKEITIPEISLEDQKRLVKSLRQADKIGKNRRKAIDLLDEYLKAVFLEMFGDPVVNDKGWEVKKLGEMFAISSGSTPSRDNKEFYIDGIIPWVKTGEVCGKTIINTEEKITQLALENSSCRIYPKNSVIIAMYGQGKTRGQAGLLGIEATTNQACCVIQPNNNLNMNFIFNYIKLSYESLRNLGRGGNQPNLNVGMIKNYKIIIPPIELQNQFAEIVQKTEMLKQSMLTQSEELDTNFNALIQGAFANQ